MSIEVTDHDDAGRYEVRVDGRLAGFADRTVRDGVMVLPHTVVDRSFRGRGLAGELVRRALDDARQRGLGVIPSCWYVAQYIGDHPADLDLVPEGQRPRYGL
jgi:predicted GNAT family acetyltransferase